MYINRVLLLTICVISLFWPAIDSWMNSAVTGWYTRYLLWLLAIAAAYWNQRSRFMDEL
jgi:hypothetical protein